MNYLRGAVSAISAPYQYYKELAPLNPSTLTGAIDVIVVRVPDENGGLELFCSPFHVRFGKWQVLRPGDKKVSVAVNGHPIPFDMKIGEAGEAFFVFETEADVPEDLITSPILEATQVGESNASADARVKAGKFGAKEDIEEPEALDLDAEPKQPANDPDSKPEDGAAQSPQLSSRPDPSRDQHPTQSPVGPSNLLHMGGGFGKAVAQAVMETEREAQEKFHDRLQAAENMALHRRLSGKSTSDQTLTGMDAEEANPNEVVYAKDVVIDYSGYHNKGVSKQVSTPSTSEIITPNTAPTPEVSGLSTPNPVPFPSYNDSEHNTRPPLTVIRATSEPPPEHDELAVPSQPTHRKHPSRTELSLTMGHKSGGSVRAAQDEGEEYMWEWGAFPQRSPAVEKFSGNAGAARWEPPPPSALGLEAMSKYDRERSVSPQLEVPTRPVSPEPGDALVLGKGARLIKDGGDGSKMGVWLDGRKWWFELALVDHATAKGKGKKGVLGGMEELEAAEAFDRGRVRYDHLMADESIVDDERLVIRWADDRYITREDGSPLMAALRSWRSAAVTAHEEGVSSRPQSPPLSDEGEDNEQEALIKRQPPQKTRSWARWWRLSSAPSDSDIEKGTLRRDPPETKDLRTSSAPSVLPPSPPPPPESPIDKSTKEEEHHDKKYVKTLRLTSDQLKQLDLKLGSNSITFSLSASGAAACTARIFVWEHNDHIVISDIDGTITKSDALGHVFAMIGRDWTHLGVAKLYTDIARNGYKIMYLTARAIGQADATRDYLKGVRQNEYQLPEGPVIMSPDRLMASLHREVIMRKPEVFKMACLRDIRRLFGKDRNPFYAGFGNRITDALSYRSVDVPSARIFTIDTTGDVKMELLELAGYKSSYIHMTDLVDQQFPPINKRWEPEFTDMNFWKAPMQEFQLPDLTPPSPALSARSETSNQSTFTRLRNISLIPSGRRPISPPLPITRPDSPTNLSGAAGSSVYGKGTHLRQMSSLERVSAALGFSSSPPASPPRGLSPDPLSSTMYDSGSEDEGADVDWQGRPRKHKRRRSITSMPGSLPGSGDDMEFEEQDYSDEEAQYSDEYEEEHEEEHVEFDPETTFDDDLAAAGEMAQVPFL